MERKGRLGEAWLTACDATLVIVQEDRGVYSASLALSPLIALCVCLFECVCVRGGVVPTAHGASRQCCLCLDSGCSSVDGNTQGKGEGVWRGRWRGGGGGGGGGVLQGNANWDRRSGSGIKDGVGKRSAGDTESPRALRWLALLNDASLS